MTYSSRLIAYIPQGDWNWDVQSLQWCNGKLWLILGDMYRWGHTTPYCMGYYWAQEQGVPNIFEVRSDGLVRVVGGLENQIQWRYDSYGSYYETNGNPGYGPNATLGWSTGLMAASTDTEIYIFNDPGIWKFDTETYQIGAIQYHYRNGGGGFWKDGDGDEAIWSYPSSAQCRRDQNGKWYVWWWEQFGLRKMLLEAPYTITSVLTPSMTPTAVQDQYTIDTDWSWATTKNTATGFPHALDDDQFAYTYVEGLVQWDGWIYMVCMPGYGYDGSPYYTPGCVRRYNPQTDVVELIMAVPEKHSGFWYSEPPPIADAAYSDSSSEYYRQANNPEMQPEEPIWTPYMEENQGYVGAAATDAGLCITGTWGNQIEYSYWNAQNSYRHLVLDLPAITAKAPFWTSHYNPDWELFPEYPEWFHDDRWGQKLYWNTGSEPRMHYSAQGAYCSDGDYVYFVEYTWWIDYMSMWFEAQSAISRLETYEPTSTANTNFRVKFEGPALQAYAAQRPITTTKELGPFELS